MRRISLSLAMAAALCLVARNLAAESRTLGGAGDRPWNGGGGEIPAAVETSVDGAAITNTPGDVVDFDFPGRPGWIFPEKADSTSNIAAEATLTSPNILTAGIADELLLMVDGDLETAFSQKGEPGGPPVLAFGAMFDVDLGARFGVNRVRFFPRNAPGFEAPGFPFQNDYLRAYELLVNDGSENSRDESGRPVLTTFKLELQNGRPVVDLRIPPQYLRFLRLKSQTVVGFEIAEFQVFGAGFVPEARYVSNVFDLGTRWGVWGKIRWIEETLGPAGQAQARITTRAGHDDTPLEFTRPGPGGSVNSALEAGRRRRHGRGRGDRAGRPGAPRCAASLPGAAVGGEEPGSPEPGGVPRPEPAGRDPGRSGRLDPVVGSLWAGGHPRHHRREHR